MSAPDYVQVLSSISKILKREVNTAILYGDPDIATVYTTLAISAEDMQNLLRDLADTIFPKNCRHERSRADKLATCLVCGDTDFGPVPTAVPKTSAEPSADENEGRADASV